MMPGKKEIKEKLDFQEKLGMHIRNVRKSLNLTQEEVAQRSGIERANIARTETGKKNPTLFMLKKLSVAMKIDLQKLLKGFK
jgi:transcriptional regulator with XRE-family HTH domain